MREAGMMILLELRSLFGINRFLNSRDKKFRRRYIGMGAAWGVLMLMVFSYVAGLVVGLSVLGLSDIAPAYLVCISSILILAFGIFKAGNVIFGSRGYDILSSMPIKPSSIVISRFFLTYVEDLLLTLAIMLPGAVTFGVMERPGMVFYVSAAIGSVFVPVIPLVISIVFGTVVMAVSSRMKHKSLVQTLLSVALVAVVLAGSFGMGGAAEDISVEQFALMAGNIGDVLGKVYPPSIWLGDAMLGKGAAGLYLFVLVSVIALAGTLVTVSKIYHNVMRKLAVNSAKHDYKIGRMERRGIIKALYVREVKRYFSSSVYVTNTIVGPIMGAMMSVGLCFMDVEQVFAEVSFDIKALAPFFVAAVFCIMTTTSTSISLEGKRFWAIRSLPISAKELFDGKILLNLSLMAPFYVVSVIALIIALKPGIGDAVWIMVIPAVLMCFAAVFGIASNIKFHNFDWENEEQIVKQSASAAIGGFAGFFMSLICAGAVFVLPGAIMKLVICAVVAGLTVLVYRWNNRVELARL